MQAAATTPRRPASFVLLRCVAGAAHGTAPHGRRSSSRAGRRSQAELDSRSIRRPHRGGAAGSSSGGYTSSRWKYVIARRCLPAAGTGKHRAGR